MAKSEFDGSFFSKGGGSSYTDKKRKEYEDWKSTIAQQAQTDSLKVPEADKPGGGGVLGKLKNVIRGTGNFIHDAAFDVKNTAVDAYQGLGDVARGYRAEQDVKHNTDALQARAAEWQKRFGSASDEQWKDPKFQAEAKKFTAETKKIVPQVSANTKQDIKSQQDVNAKKLAFQSAETFLNVAPVVGGVLKTFAKEGVELAAKQAIEHAVKTGGTDALEALIKEGGQSATKEIAKQGGKELLAKIGEGSLFGAAYGATGTGKANPNASAKDFIKGAGVGAVVGGALPVVAEGVGKIKNRLTTEATDKASQTINSVEDLSAKAKNSLENDATGIKKGGVERSGTRVENATAKPVEYRRLEDGSVVIQDGRHTLEYARKNNISDFPMKDVTAEYSKDPLIRDQYRAANLTPEQYQKEFSAPKAPMTLETAKLEQDSLRKNLGGTIVSPSATEIKDSGIRSKINEIFQPVKNLGEDTQKTFKVNAGGRNAAEVEGRFVQKNLQKAADEAGVKLDMNLAHQIEAGTAPDNAFTQQFRAIADKTRQEAVDAGLDIGYREDYVPHMWEQSPEAVDKLARGAGLKPQAGFKRVVPTYEEGLKLGLKPKYTDPAEMMGAYVKNLQTTRTNVALLSDLKEQGLVKSGRPPAGWKTIAAEGFPRTANGNQLSAPKQVATILNNIYGNSDSLIDKGLRKTAKFNSVWQDIALAGGIPKTPANFFTFSQMMKEGALGIGQLVTGSPIRGAKTIYSPIAAFTRSFSTKQTDKFFQANSGFLESMAKRGVKIVTSDSAGKWDQLFNEPTFGKFMPNLQLNTAKNVQNALEKKIGREAALDLTAETMKKMYGITDQLATGRSQAVQDAIGSIAFAPKYRESIVNVLGNTLKSVADPRTYGDRSYSLNRRLAVGLGATYMLYDQLNRQTTGHGMNENPEGKELTLAIPYGGKDSKGNQKVVYIPFMPSFMTLPRAAVGVAKGVAKGDMDAVAAEGGKFLSMPIQTASQLASNKDYFGRPIVIDENAARASRKEEDTNFEKFKKRLGYVVGQSSPAVVRGVIGAAQGKPLEQNLAQVGEAPVRFGTESPMSNKDRSFSPGQVTGDFYDTYNPLNAKRTAASKEVTALVKQGRVNEAKRKAQEFNASLNGKFGKYYRKYGDNPTSDPMWDEMLNGLFIKTTENSFKARAKQ